MAIVLLCPGCKVRLTLDGDRAGTTFDCPKCDAAIAVPIVVSHSTPLPLGGDESDSASPEPLPEPERSTTDDEPEDDALDAAWARRYRNERRRRARARLIRKLVALAILCAITVVSYRQTVRKDGDRDVVPRTIAEGGDDKRLLNQSGLAAVERELKAKPNVVVDDNRDVLTFKITTVDTDGRGLLVKINHPDGFTSIVGIVDAGTPERARLGFDEYRRNYIAIVRHGLVVSDDQIRRTVQKTMRTSGRFILVDHGVVGDGIEWFERHYRLD